METQIKVLEKNGEKMAFFTFHDPRNRSQEMLAWQQRVMDFYKVPVNYVEIDYTQVNHGGAMEWVIKSFGSQIDYFTFFDNDCIPTHKHIVDIIYSKIFDKRTVFGGVQNSNHIHENHPIICPSSISFSTKLYVDLGQPHLGDLIKRSDTCEELIWLCQEKGYNVCYVYPTSFYTLTPEEQAATGNPEKWNLGNGLFYGLCTQYGDLFFHRGMQNIQRGEEIFINKCKEILSPKTISQPKWLTEIFEKAKEAKKTKLPAWVENVKGFLPHKYQDFLEDSVKNTGHTKQYLYLKELSDKYKNELILDLGSDCGLSALALGVNGNNKVLSFDIADLYPKEKGEIQSKYKNIEFRIQNLLDYPTKAKELFKQAKLIYLDAGEHDGIIETEFYELIKESGFSGELVCDDIRLNEGMVRFWSKIEENKESKENLHWSGTGHVNFVNRKIEAIIVSVNYADFLEVTLQSNREYFDNVLVVTTPTDKETQAVCYEYGVEFYATDAFYANGAKFNKGLAISEAFGELKYKDWVCILDADCLLDNSFLVKFDKNTADIEKFYGGGRTFIYTYEDYLDYIGGAKSLYDFEYKEGKGNGYMQLFNLNSEVAKSEDLKTLYPSHSENVWIDIAFLKKWCPLVEKDTNLVDLKINVIHLGLHSVFKNGRGEEARFDYFKHKKFNEIKRDEVQQYIKEINK